MSKSRRRSLSTAQINMRVMHFFINGSAGAAVEVQGFDRFNATIVRNAAGDYTITFKTAFLRPVMGFCQVAQALAAGLVITAIIASSIRVKNQTAAVDVDFFLQVVGSEFAYDVA